MDHNFFDTVNHFVSGATGSLPPKDITFRDRFTAAFLRYLRKVNKIPEEAIAPFGRSWRHFQRYLIGGDQTPKMDVVVALASASGVPVEWIIDGPSRVDGDPAKPLADLEILEFHCGNAAREGVVEAFGVRAQLPASILHAVELSPPSAKLVVVHGSGGTTAFRDGDLLLLDVNNEGRTLTQAGGVYLLKIADVAYLQSVVLSKDGLCLSDAGDYGGIYRECSDINAVEVIGRAVWIGRSL